MTKGVENVAGDSSCVGMTKRVENVVGDSSCVGMTKRVKIPPASE
jgi:hypothetical protein